MDHRHKNGKDGLEGSLVRVFFATELAFSKFLVPRLPQNTSNVNIESTGESKHLLFMWTTSLSPDISLIYCSNINLF